MTKHQQHCNKITIKGFQKSNSDIYERNVHWQPHENQGHQHVQMSLNSETDACIYFHELVTDKIMEASSIRHQSFVFQQNTKSTHEWLTSWITPKPFNMR